MTAYAVSLALAGAATSLLGYILALRAYRRTRMMAVSVKLNADRAEKALIAINAARVDLYTAPKSPLKRFPTIPPTPDARPYFGGVHEPPE